MDVLFTLEFTCFHFSIFCQETLKGRGSSVNLIEQILKNSENKFILNTQILGNGKDFVASAESSVNECITYYTSETLKIDFGERTFNRLYISFFLFSLLASLLMFINITFASFLSSVEHSSWILFHSPHPHLPLKNSWKFFA